MRSNNRAGVGSLWLLLVATAGACLAQQVPSSLDAVSLAARVLTQSGQVSVFRSTRVFGTPAAVAVGSVSKDVDAQPWALSVGDSVNVRDLIVTGVDGHAILQVSDGSTFEVFPNSRVVFRKNAPNWRDFLDVLVGRVRIQIQHFGNTPNPNRVVTPTAVISVRGTIFDVSVDDDDETTLVEVEDGQVEVQHALLPRGNARVLSPGETLKIYRGEPLAHNLDKGSIARQVLRSVADIAVAIVTRGNSGSGGMGGAAGGGVGDTGKTPPPAPPPAPPAPPQP